MSFPKYEAYKDSGVEWLGKVPDHWGVMALKYVTSMKGRIGFRGYTTEDIVAEGDGAITLSPSNMVHGELDFSKATYIGWGKYHESPEIQLSLGDTVIVKTGSTYGRVAFVQDLPLEATVNPQIAIFKTELSDKKFLFFLVSSKYFHALARNSNTGSTMPTMTQESVLSFLIALPSWKEQTQIARFLDHETARIDALIAEQQRLIELLKEKRQAVLSHAVTKGLDPTAPMKDSGVEWLGEVPAHWRLQKLKHLFRLVKRQESAIAPVLSVYRNYGVIEKSSRSDNHNKTPEDLTRYQSVGIGDLVINKMKAWQGSLGISKHQGITSPDYVVYEPTHLEEGMFLHYLLRSSRMPGVYKSMSNGIRPDQWRLEPDLFEQLLVPLPTASEQEEIVQKLEYQLRAFDQLSGEMEQNINLLQERRAALISAAVTGKIDVRGWQAPASASPSPTLEPVHS